MRAPGALLASLLAIACTPVMPAEPPDDTALPEPVEPAVDTQTPPEPAESPITPAEEDTTTGPTRFAAIGSSCANVEDGVTAQCDGEGMAVSLSAPVDMVPDIPWDRIQLIHEATGLDRGASIKVGHTGERLWIQRVSCGICRRIIGVAIVADLDRLDDDQRRRIQDEAGVPTEPVLRNVADWRRTLAPQ